MGLRHDKLPAQKVFQRLAREYQESRRSKSDKSVRPKYPSRVEREDKIWEQHQRSASDSLRRITLTALLIDDDKTHSLLAKASAASKQAFLK
jgi:hypothetical protein